MGGARFCAFAIHVNEGGNVLSPRTPTLNTRDLDQLIQKLETRTARVGIIGLGYAGLPLAVAFAEAGFAVVGIDLQESRVNAINASESYIGDVPAERIAPLVAEQRLRASTDYAALADIDAVTICVPTPLTEDKGPDPSAVAAAARSLQPWLRHGQVIVLESTSFPGTTEEILLPIVEATGLKVGEEIFVAFAPERVNPGDTKYGTRNTPKLVGGVTPACSAAAIALYSTIITDVSSVSSPRVAEMAKLMENTFRQINIAFANEMAIVCERLGIDVWEATAAAATKPFGYLPFYPGPGLGGPCIPVVPHYLAWKSRQLGYEPRLIGLADQVNEAMPGYVVDLTERALAAQGVDLAGASVLMLGITYKADVSDTRVSPPMQILGLLRARGVNAQYHDPLVPSFAIAGTEAASAALNAEALRAADAVLIATDHGSFDWEWVVRHARLVIDTRNATANVDAGVRAGTSIVRLGAPLGVSR